MGSLWSFSSKIEAEYVSMHTVIKDTLLSEMSSAHWEVRLYSNEYKD